MDLSDALGDWPNGGGNQNQPAWPGQPAAPGGWPGPPAPNPTWPGQPAPNPTWPGGPSPQPSAPGGWPSGPSPQPSAPGGWPSGPSPQPSAPGGWPSTGPGPGPAPGPAPGGWPTPAVAPQQNLSVPFRQDFSSGLNDKMLITIAGTIKPHPNMFIVDFLSGSDLVFHFNPRFNEAGRAVIVRNSEISKKWGKEERDLPHFPFSPGQGFEMKILVTSASFRVAVNNSHLLEFKHRHTNLRSINRMNIYHDVTLSKVNMETMS